MEEISKTAKAYYYTHLTEKQKQSTIDVFKAMDKDGDGKISLEEYDKYIKNKFKSNSIAKIFKKMNKDRNGMLDFDEFITLQYLMTNQRVYFCDGCKDFLDGAYFTCVQCFNDSSGDTYDLCCDCYGHRVHHHHVVFLDNYTLLQSLRDKFKRKREPTFNTMRMSSGFGGTSTGFGGSACGGGFGGSACGGGSSSC